MDELIVLSKSISTSLSSPIDTLRQNYITRRGVTFNKVRNGVFVSFISSFLITYPCQKIISFCQNRDMNQVLSVVVGVCLSNAIKSPIVYNYKRVQTGMGLTARIPLKNMSKVYGMSLIEDVLEECVRYTFTNKNKSEHSFHNSCRQSFTLFSLSYPFDLLKNREYHGIRNLKASKLDITTKVVHKNLQHLMYFQILNGVMSCMPCDTHVDNPDKYVLES